mmetsp:Transcript_32005/g.46121  ORF Transcript_32005/g.46121 Transcript_32005/m.46121 type:complete len:278 (-) Transcript_32005:196-1029(-)
MATDYSSEEYWNNRYCRVCTFVEEESHEWYYSFEVLLPLMKKYFPKTSDLRILEVGCGDRPLIVGFNHSAADLLKDSILSLDAIDFSQTVIDVLKTRYSNSDEKETSQIVIDYKCMDARKMIYESEYFDFIIDKGTIDAMLCSESSKRAQNNVSKIIKEAVRTLKSTGIIMIVSHIELESDEFDILIMKIILPILNENRSRYWKIDAHVVSKPSVEEPKKKSKRQKRDTVESHPVENESFGTVYVITGSVRRQTRHSQDNSKAVFDVPFTVHEYAAE